LAPTILKLGTIHLLAESFPTSYRPQNSDKNCRKSIFSFFDCSSVLTLKKSVLIVFFPAAHAGQRKASLVLGDFLEGSETDSSDEQQYSNNNAKQRQPSPARGRQKWKPIPKARRCG
jgi:hypothetical protein